MKFGTNIHHVSGHCCKTFQDQRSQVMHVQMCQFYRADANTVMVRRQVNLDLFTCFSSL